MRDVTVGIIGCGGIANGKHMPSLKKLSNVKMVAFCDVVKEKAEKAAQKYGEEGARVYTDYKEMLEKENLEVVHVCTPNKSHSPITVAALEKSDKADGTVLQQSEAEGNIVNKGTTVSVIVAGSNTLSILVIGTIRSFQVLVVITTYPFSDISMLAFVESVSSITPITSSSPSRSVTPTIEVM